MRAKRTGPARERRPLGAARGAFILAFALLLVAALAAGALSLPSFDGTAWLALAGVLVFFCAGFFAIFRGIAMIGSVRAATIMNLEPVATIALAPLILAESLTAQQLVGAAIVIAAVIASQRR